MPADRWPRVLNQVLPPDLSAIKATVVPDDFNSRFWAIDRHYRYRILTGQRDPHRTRYAWHYGKPLDAGLMHEAAQAFVGTHNFIAFSQLLDEKKNPDRTLFSLKVRQVRDEIWIDVVGQAFVRGMMRRISGCLWEIGRGKYAPSRVPLLLSKRRKSEVDWPPVLPACGLTLMNIRYGRHPSDHRFRRTDTPTGQTK